MANFTTAIAEENEIVKAEDVSFGYEAAIDNVARALHAALGSGSGNYVIGGTVTPYDGGGLNVMVSPIYAYCSSTEAAVVETESTGPISLEEEEDMNRIDIIQVQGAEEGYDYQVRMFNDPSSGTKSSESLNTKKRVALSVAVKKGTPGAGSAPSVDEGWIKLAEVEILASNNAIQESQIRNVTAREYGGNNELWTTDASATYNPGSLVNTLSTFLVAHNEDGSHKDKVIDGDDIDWGTGTSQVKGTLMPTGQSTQLYENGKLTDWDSSKTVTPLLLALVENINKLFPFANNILSRYTIAEVSPVAATNGEEVDVNTGGAMTIDGVAVLDGQAVLLKNQTDKKENGIWRVNASGAWTRCEGFAARDSEALTHKLIVVSGGAANGGKAFYLEGDTYAIGTADLDFKESIFSFHATPLKAVLRDEYGQVLVPTTAPDIPANGSIWISENALEDDDGDATEVAGNTYKHEVADHSSLTGMGLDSVELEFSEGDIVLVTIQYSSYADGSGGDVYAATLSATYECDGNNVYVTLPESSEGTTATLELTLMTDNALMLTGIELGGGDSYTVYGSGGSGETDATGINIFDANAVGLADGDDNPSVFELAEDDSEGELEEED